MYKSECLGSTFIAVILTLFAYLLFNHHFQMPLFKRTTTNWTTRTLADKQDKMKFNTRKWNPNSCVIQMIVPLSKSDKNKLKFGTRENRTIPFVNGNPRSYGSLLTIHR